MLSFGLPRLVTTFSSSCLWFKCGEVKGKKGIEKEREQTGKGGGLRINRALTFKKETAEK